MRDDRVLLFDLGGVLVESAGQDALRRLLPHLSEEEVLARWLKSGAVARFERGAIAPEEFARVFLSEWSLQLDPSRFLSEFASWVRGFLPGASRLLARLRGRHTLGCLSNTNATHWARLTEVRGAFDVCMASHLTGHMKPDPRAYEHALRSIGVRAQNVYFFDDLLPNVVAARALGIHAFHVRGVQQTQHALRDVGISVDDDA